MRAREAGRAMSGRGKGNDGASASNHRLRICYFGTYEREYPRNRVLIGGLRVCGGEVVECHEEVWGLTQYKLEDYFQAKSLLRLAVRYLAACLRLLAKHRRTGAYDVLVVGFNGHMDIFLARLLAWWRRCPLVFDPLTSIYNSLVEDKGYYPEGSLRARCVLSLEKLICGLSDLVILDTMAHAAYYEKRLGVPTEKLAVIPVGADDAVFAPEGMRAPSGARFTVLYYGKYLPLHGVEHILEAARLLADHADIEFKMIGKGQFWDRAREITGAATDSSASRVIFIDPVEYPQLPRYIRESDVCLGIFGGTLKAGMVVPNKAYQAMAMGRPLITGDSPAAREVFVDGETALLVPMKDGRSLAKAILRVKEDPALGTRLGGQSLAAFRERYSRRVLGGRFLRLLAQIATLHGARRGNLA